LVLIVISYVCERFVLALILTGFMTGLLVGLTGVGGGSLMTPVLLLFFGVAPVAAVGTDLWFAALTKMVAGRVHHGHDLIDWQVVKRLWLGSLPAVVLVMSMLKNGWLVLDFAFLSPLLAILLLITALGLLFQSAIHNWGKFLRLKNGQVFKSWQLPLTILAGILLGTLVSLTSIGAGALGAVILTCLYPLRLTPPRLVATDIIHAIPLAIFAGLGYFYMGQVDFELLLYLLAGSIPGVLIGSKLTAFLPERYIRLSIVVVLMAVAVKLLRGSKWII